MPHVTGARRTTPARAALVALVFAALFAPAAARGQSCYSSSSPQYFYDLCDNTTFGQNYEYMGSMTGTFVASGTNYLLAGLENDLLVYDAANPLTVNKLATLHIPWDWNTINVLGSTHEQYVTHVRSIATLPGFNYGLVSLWTYGWDFLKLNGASSQFLGHGYHPSVKFVSGGYDRSALFQNGTTVYAAAQMLDQTSISSGDYSIRIYPIGGSTPLGPINTDTLTSANMGPGVVVPIGHPTDATGFQDSNFALYLGVRLWILNTGGYRLLIARSQTITTRALAIIDITNPNTPTPLLVLGNQVDPGKTLLAGGGWATDDARSLLWVGDASVSNAYGFKIDTSSMPAAPPMVTLQTTVNWRGGTSPQALGVTQVEVSGNLLTAWTIGKMGYVGLSATGAANLLSTPVVPFTDLDPNHVCLNTGYAEGINDTTPFVVNGSYYVARSLGVDADIVAVSGSCMSTTPSPAFTVTATTPTAAGPVPSAASCAGTFTPPSTGIASVGFPGDTFAIADTSTGTISNGSLVITPTTSGTQSWSEAGANAWTPQPLAWASPASGPPGEYHVAMTLYDSSGKDYSLTKSVYLCSTPQAGIQITAVNGTPCTGAGCVYLANDQVTFSAAPGISQGTPTLWAWFDNGSLYTQTPSAVPTLNYTLPSDGSTHQISVAAIYGFTGTVDSTSCGSMAASVQNGGNWASCASYAAITPQQFVVGSVTASQGGSTFPNFNTSSSITLSAPYTLAAGYSATFGWSGSVSSVSLATPATVPASGSRQSGTVTGSIATPLVGNNQTVTLAASATNGTNPITITPAPSTTFNVTTCSNGAPINLSPNNTTINPGTITLSWSPAPGASPAPLYTVTWGFSAYGSCTNISGTTCSVPATTPGSQYRWSVAATNSCGTYPSATASFTTSGSLPTPTPTPTATPTPPPGGRLTITPSPNPANVGQYVTFTFSPALSTSGDSLTFTSFGDGTTAQTVSYPSCQQFPAGCSTISHAYASASSSFTVTASGVAGGTAVSGSTTVAVVAPCSATAAPVAAFTYAPSQLTVQFTDTSTNGPTSWSWNFGDGGGILLQGSSTAQSPLYTFKAAGTYTVTLTATNCKGSSQTSQRVTVSACSQSAPPAADFTWGPTGALANFPEQQQPYVGQLVTLTDASTGSPTSWHWYDFNELAVNATVSTPTYTFTWPASLPPGVKNVRMTATNCFGTSAEVMHTVTIYPDVRHVVADFTWSSGTLATGSPVTLTADTGPTYGDPDTFVWTFDDGSPQQNGASTTHTFTCAGSRTVTLTASRSNYAAATASTSHTLTLTGQQCGPDSVMTVDAAQLSGVNDTSWLSNVRIFNPSSQTSQITVQFLPIGYNNTTPSGVTKPVLPNATLVLDNVIKWGQDNGAIGTDVKKAALRILYSTPDGVAPIVISETYNTPPSGGGTYGQLTPGIEVVPNTTAPTLWITGIRNNGTGAGFRTNYSLVNLRDTATSSLVFTLLDPTGTALATQTISLNPYEYRQDSLAKLFGGAAAATSPDPLALKVTVPAGSDIQAYTSVVDNLTGDPVLIPAVAPPAAPQYLPAVAFTPGANGTVWRSDFQLTNPDSAPHTWSVTYTPGGQGTLPIVTQKQTLAAQSTKRYDDLLSWLYGGTLSDTTKTSGVVEITPADGSSVYPVVQARSFNQTANGTFGQNIPPITPDMGVAAGQGKRLYLTGMSSQDIARTNLGFVSLSDTTGVNFVVTFYDESGNVLNPKDGQGNPIPYTFWLAPDGWDQDKLENRFSNAGWPALPGGLRAISAVIQVSDGGPGTVYATVIDNLTGDPNFILAQPAP